MNHGMRAKIAVTAGLVLVATGFLVWLATGMPLEELLPGKKAFGTNVLHVSLFGLVMVAYGIFESFLG